LRTNGRVVAALKRRTATVAIKCLETDCRVLGAGRKAERIITLNRVVVAQAGVLTSRSRLRRKRTAGGCEKDEDERALRRAVH
jgi:hypothetical protein